MRLILALYCTQGEHVEEALQLAESVLAGPLLSPTHRLRLKLLNVLQHSIYIMLLISYSMALYIFSSKGTGTAQLSLRW